MEAANEYQKHRKQMKIIMKYKAVILIVLPILILILIRAFNPNHFRRNVKEWAEPSVMQLNIVNKEQLETLSGDKLIINLGTPTDSENTITDDAVHIAADSILMKNNLSTIRNHKGPIILYAFESSVAARIWMVLSQMGYRNIYILTTDTGNEVIKNKFRPDTLVRPEF